MIPHIRNLMQGVLQKELRTTRFTGAKTEHIIYYFNIHIIPTADRWKNRQDSLQAQDSIR